MSNGEVKRWKAVASIKTRSPFVSVEYVEGDVVSACDHDRIVAEKDAEIKRLELVAMAAAESIKEKYKIMDTQKRVIEMLLENWDGPFGMAVIQSKIKAIEKGEA